jgi:hypothetical protein
MMVDLPPYRDSDRARDGIDDKDVDRVADVAAWYLTMRL